MTIANAEIGGQGEGHAPASNHRRPGTGRTTGADRPEDEARGPSTRTCGLQWRDQVWVSVGAPPPHAAVPTALACPFRRGRPDHHQSTCRTKPKRGLADPVANCDGNLTPRPVADGWTSSGSRHRTCMTPAAAIPVPAATLPTHGRCIPPATASHAGPMPTPPSIIHRSEGGGCCPSVTVTPRLRPPEKGPRVGGIAGEIGAEYGRTYWHKGNRAPSALSALACDPLASTVAVFPVGTRMPPPPPLLGRVGAGWAFVLMRIHATSVAH